MQYQAALCSFLYVALSFFPSLQEQNLSDARQSDEQAIRAADAEMMRASQHKDLNGLLSFYAEDATFFPVEEPIAVGKQAIRAVWKRYFAIPGFSNPRWLITKLEVSRSGDLAYTQGIYETTLEDVKGNRVIEHGKWVNVWKKQPNGSWKIVADIGNTDSEPPSHKPPRIDHEQRQ